MWPSLITYKLNVTEHSQRLFPRYGTTSFLATVVLPQGHPRTQATLSVLNDRCGKTGYGAVLEGIHAEVCTQPQLKPLQTLEKYVVVSSKQ